jgi:hypothetical protein
MSAARPPIFGEVAPELELRDFEPVPIRHGSKAPAPDCWQRGGPAAAWLARYARCGTGLLTRRTPAIDIDVRHAEAAEAVDQLAADELGDGPVRFGQPPKRLRLYQAEVPFAKIASRELVLPGDHPGDKPHKIEVLADGQQFVAFAIHPDTGLPYVWPGSSPLDLERQDLPEITAEVAAAFVVQAEDLLVRQFKALPKASRSHQRRPQGEWKPGPAPRRSADPAEAWFVLEALANLPNDNLDYDTWVEVAYALKAALGEAGWNPFEAWSRQSRKYDAETTAKTWRYARPARADWRFLIELAGGDAPGAAGASAALRCAVARVLEAPPARSGRVLYSEAQDLGRLVAAGSLPPELAFMGLAAVAEQAGVPADEAALTLRRGLLAGEARHG